MCTVYVVAEGSWMPGIHLNDDLYVHNEVHTHMYVVDVHATCKWRFRKVSCDKYRMLDHVHVYTYIHHHCW